MNHSVKRIARAGLWAGAAAITLSSSSGPLLARDESCVSDWGAAGTIVREQGLRTVEQVAREGPNAVPGQIVQAKLCLAGVGYVYRFVVRDPSGSLRNVVVEAKPGAGTVK